MERSCIVNPKTYLQWIYNKKNKFITLTKYKNVKKYNFNFLHC